ncbi:MAG TPA: tetratricopeptide repeat protein [Anaerolineales bacterium]|nr:tetratricopeptide repeat protein [Anaerolineales bacterium]
MQGLIGQELGGYRIIAQIGKGGMATVFKAYQPSLDRYVAIKVLPPYYAEQDETFLKRFRQEAKAIASLRHPNILIVLDYGELERTTYLVMEFVEAGTLGGQMGKPMAPGQMAGLVGQVAGALHYAHQEGVVHRDIKPSNILLPKPNWPLLTDFGLAKIVGGTQLTQSGTVAGTPAYMSPEQGRGERVDHRSDIYSLGIVLYEMATGVVPFQAETPMAVIVKHIIDPLPLPRSKTPELSEAIERVILKALAKEPADRFQDVGQLAEALTAAVGTLPPGKASVAPSFPSHELTTLQVTGSGVAAQLPVATRVDPEEGMAEAVAAGARAKGAKSWWFRLGLAAGVLVLGFVGFAAARALGFGGSAGSPIADEPGEARTLEQLVADGYANLQSGDFEAAIRDFERAIEREPGNPERYFDVARAYFASGDPDAASDLIQEAVDLIPGDSGVHESAGWVYQELGLHEEAASEFRAALELDPQELWLYAAISDSYLAAGLPEEAAGVLAEGLANPEVAADSASLESIGWVFLSLGDPAQAERTFNQAITAGADFPGPWEGLAEAVYQQGELVDALAILADGMQYFPEHVPFYQTTGELLWEQGELEQAATSFQQAIALDPANSSSYSSLARMYSEMGLLKEAEQVLLGGLEAHPENTSFYGDLASYYSGQGRYADAVPLYETLTQAEPDNGWWFAYLADTYRNLGDPENARRVLGEAADRSSGDGWLNDFIGWIYVGLGDCDTALGHFEYALELDSSIESSAEGLQSCGG